MGPPQPAFQHRVRPLPHTMPCFHLSTLLTHGCPPSMLFSAVGSGFGPTLLSYKSPKDEIEYTLRLIPMGGFVSFPKHYEIDSDGKLLKSLPSAFPPSAFRSVASEPRPESLTPNCLRLTGRVVWQATSSGTRTRTCFRTGRLCSRRWSSWPASSSMCCSASPSSSAPSGAAHTSNPVVVVVAGSQ